MTAMMRLSELIERLEAPAPRTYLTQNDLEALAIMGEHRHQLALERIERERREREKSSDPTK